MPLKAPSFGSSEYWDNRFANEIQPFDWLSSPETLDSHIADALQSVDTKEPPQVLHVGCGSSLLSQHLKSHVRRARQVHNVDYSSVVIEAERKRDEEASSRDEDRMRWEVMDLLAPGSVVQTCGQAAYDVVVDKSTSDSVSCADDVVGRFPCTTSKSDVANSAESRQTPVYPLHAMVLNLAMVAKPGARWIAVSYSAERFSMLQDHQDDGAGDGIPDPGLFWTVVGKYPLEASEEDGGGGGAATHRPKVYHWVYVLQRTDVPLRFDAGG